MKYLAYQEKIVVYLTYQEYQANAVYSYFLDDKLIATTDKPDFTFDNLSANTEYKIKITLEDKVIDEKIIRTLLKRKNIVVDIKENDGKSLVTNEIQKYLDEADENTTIVFPKGTYLTGALFVKSNSEIVLEKGALILGSSSYKDYLPKIKSRFEGIEMDCYASLINIGFLNHNKGYTTQNIIIRGSGEIRGGGNALREEIINKELDFIDRSSQSVNQVGAVVVAGRSRNRLINISNAENVIIDGLKLGYSASWNLHYLYSKKIYIHHCSFESFGIHNGDGIDPDSSSESDIFANTFDVGDDCIAIKSGKNPEGNLINIPSHDISIFDCVTYKGHGCSIGSEISGGIYNIYMYHLDFARTLYGLHIKTTLKRGGYVKHVFVNNATFPSINIRTVTYNDDGEASKEVSKFNDFHISNITLTSVIYLQEDKTDNCTAIQIEGFDKFDTFTNFYLNNITIMNHTNEIESQKIKNVNSIIFSNVSLKEEKYEY